MKHICAEELVKNYVVRNVVSTASLKYTCLKNKE
jgi:hypothetical protein